MSAEDPLVTLESDKATMDVPAPFAGTVKTITVKVGDRVSQGTRVAGDRALRGDAPTANHGRRRPRIEGAGSEAEAPGRDRQPRREAEQQAADPPSQGVRARASA